MKLSRLVVLAKLKEKQAARLKAEKNSRRRRFENNKKEALRCAERYFALANAKTPEEYNKLSGYGKHVYHDPYAETIELLSMSTDDNVAVSSGNLKYLLFSLGGK